MSEFPGHPHPSLGMLPQRSSLQRMGDLVVLHLKKGEGASVPPRVQLLGPAFSMETCQRSLQVTWIQNVNQLSFEGVGRLSVFRGAEAYAFLLRFASGLESAVVGETDVFGQLKEAWQSFEVTGEKLAHELLPWMQRVFEDTKEIRARHLQGLGGTSYGTLVRLLLREDAARPVMIVGAGKIAESVAPYLLDGEVWILNRTRERAEQLAALLRQNSSTAKIRIIDSKNEAQAYAEAGSLVMCTPLDASQDLARASAWSSAGPASGRRRVVHLGCRRGESSPWWNVPGFQCLDDLFAIQAAQENARNEKAEAARRACLERAELRLLGNGSLSISHGWEDLAVFA